MGGKRTLIVVTAVVAAAVAAFANYAYLSSVQDRAYHNAERLRVFVVSKDVKRGLPGEQAVDGEFVKSDEIPREFRPGTAVTDLNSIKGKLASADLSVGQVLVEGMFVTNDPTLSFSAKIPQGKVAVTVQVDQVRGVAGLLVPGDKVNIMVTDGDAERHLFQNVPVIAIGSTAAAQPGEVTAVNPGSGLITFAVPSVAAARIALASQRGALYLTLVPPDNQPTPIPPIGPADLFSGGLEP